MRKSAERAGARIDNRPLVSQEKTMRVSHRLSFSPMTLIETINKDFTAAMKERREAELSTLRMLRAALKNRQIELMHELTEDEAMAVVKSQIKQLKDAMESFGTREDLRVKTEAELAVLEKYLPAQLSDAELDGIVKEAVAGSGAQSKADMGRAMGAAMKAVVGRADGNRVKAVVEKLLACLTLAVVFSLGNAPNVLAASSTRTEPDETWGWVSDIGPEFALRLARPVAVLFAIMFTMTMLIGGFHQMNSSGKDLHVSRGRREIALGLLGTVFMVAAYLAASTALVRIAT